MPDMVLDEASMRYVRMQLARIRRVDLMIAIAFWIAYCCLWLLMITAAVDTVWHFLHHRSGMAVAAGTITGGACFTAQWARRTWARRCSRLIPPPALPANLTN